MSTNPTSGLTGDNTLNSPNTTYDNNTPNTTNEKGGVIPTVLSYVGLGGGNNSTSSTTGTASDATTEPAFGAAVAPHSNSSSAGVLGGSSNSNPSTGGVLGSTGGVMSGSNTVGSNSADASYAPAPTLNPHDEERARVVAERAMGSTSTSTTGAGVGGLESGVGHHGSGVGSGVGLGSGAGVGSGVGSGVGLGSGHESAHHGSGVGSGVGLGSGAGLASGVGSDRHASGVGSGVGLDSDRHGSGVGSGVGLDSARHGSGVGSGVGLDKSASNVDPPSEERHGSTSGQDSHKPPVTGPTKGSLENKSAIPTAGGVKLGEKHWGESDFVPEFPKKSEEKVSSSSGQPDQSTRDNTAANKGDSSTIPPTGAGEHGEQKEGMMDKVKHTLHMGGSK